MGAPLQDSEQNLDVFIGFLDPENIVLACLIKLLSCLEAKIEQIMYLIAAILNVQNGGLPGVCANGNIHFWNPQVLRIPKMYSLSNLQKI